MGGCIDTCCFTDRPTGLMCIGDSPEAIRFAFEERDKLPYSYEITFHRTSYYKNLTTVGCSGYADRFTSDYGVKYTHKRKGRALPELGPDWFRKMRCETFQQCLENIKKWK